MNIKWISLLLHTLILPELFFGICIIYLVLHCLFLGQNRNNRLFLTEKSTTFLIILVISMTCFLLINQIFFDSKILSFNNNFVSDILSNSSKVIIGIVSVVYFFILQHFIEIKKANSFEYYIVFLFALLGTFLVCTVNDLLAAYLSIELQSLSFYLLASYHKNSTYSVESGLKYFILGSFSSGLFLYGSSILYGLFGTLNFTDFFDFTEDFVESNVLSLDTFQYPLLIILISLLFKLAIAPFHIWLPDIYEGSFFSSSFFFAVVPKLSILILFFKLFHFCFFNITFYLTDYLVFSAIFSIIIGSFAGLEQRKLKSLLAYSSISHMGYILMVFSLPNSEGLSLGLSYIIVYMISSICLWMILMLTTVKIIHTKKQNKDLIDLVLIQKSNLGLGVSLNIVLFSFAGFPPFIGFLVKVGLFLAALEISYYLICFLSIFCSVISTFYYIRIIKIIYFETVLTGKLYYPIKTQITLVLVTIVYILLFFFVKPNLLIYICYKVSLS